MSNKKEINNFIKEKIRQNVSRSQIENELSLKYKINEYQSIVGNYPENPVLKKYKKINNILRGLIIILLAQEVLGVVISLLNISTIVLLLKLIKVFIYIILLRQTKSFLATGYVNTFLLFLFFLFQTYNMAEKVFDSGSDLVIILFTLNFIFEVLLVCLSYYLLKKIHPKSKFISKKI